jgi:hypothetical protein
MSSAPAYTDTKITPSKVRFQSKLLKVRFWPRHAVHANRTPRLPADGRFQPERTRVHDPIAAGPVSSLRCL